MQPGQLLRNASVPIPAGTDQAPKGPSPIASSSCWSTPGYRRRRLPPPRPARRPLSLGLIEDLRTRPSPEMG